MIKSVMKAFGNHARERRAVFLKNLMSLDPSLSILDLGGGDGSHIARVFPHHRNITVCDYAEDDLKVARQKYGFNTVLADGTGRLPFSDKEYDFVFCSSVIEHVTGPKNAAVANRSTKSFQQDAHLYQTAFSEEIKRVARSYYVQTPHRYFILESHSWLPLPLGLLPRLILIPLLRLSGKVLKPTEPDWNLLTPAQMKSLFPDARIYIERFSGWPKSIMAIKGLD